MFMMNQFMVQNNIDIVKHKEIKIPMAYGIFHRRIVLPEIEYSEEEIDIILHHELIHHKHHDLLWKAILSSLFQKVL